MVSKVYVSHHNVLSKCLEELYKNIKVDFGDECDFYFFAVHPIFPVNEIIPLIEKFFKTKNYVAFHAINAFKNDEVYSNAVVMCCIKFQKNGHAKTFYLENMHKSPEKTVSECTKYLNENSKSFHIMLTGLADNTFGVFLENLSKNLENRIISNIVGGISSGFEQNGETLTYQFIDGKIIKNGLVIVTFENIEAAVEVSLGFKPYGVTYVVDKSDGNDLYSVSPEKKFIQIVNSILSGIKNPEVCYLWYAPLYIIDEEDGYNSTLRTIKEIKDDYVVLYSPISNGDKFKLSFAMPEDLIEEDREAAFRLKQRLNSPELAFNFSCIARQYVMGEKEMEEPEVYTKILNTNLFGFFTFGEIGPDKKFKDIKLHNDTSLLVAMREIWEKMKNVNY